MNCTVPKTIIPQTKGSVVGLQASRHADLLNTEKVEWLDVLALNLQAEFNRLPHPGHEIVERFRLCVTTPQSRDGADVVSIGIPFDNDAR